MAIYSNQTTYVFTPYELFPKQQYQFNSLNMDFPRELLSDIAKDFDGDFFQDETTRILYATDGSV
jgi:hypothetical protein